MSWAKRRDRKTGGKRVAHRARRDGMKTEREARRHENETGGETQDGTRDETEWTTSGGFDEGGARDKLGAV